MPVFRAYCMLDCFYDFWKFLVCTRILLDLYASTFGQPAKDTQSQTGSLAFRQSAQDTQEPAKFFSFVRNETQSLDKGSSPRIGTTCT